MPPRSRMMGVVAIALLTVVVVPSVVSATSVVGARGGIIGACPTTATPFQPFNLECSSSAARGPSSFASIWWPGDVILGDTPGSNISVIVPASTGGTIGSIKTKHDGFEFVMSYGHGSNTGLNITMSFVKVLGYDAQGRDILSAEGEQPDDANLMGCLNPNEVGSQTDDFGDWQTPSGQYQFGLAYTSLGQSIETPMRFPNYGGQLHGTGTAVIQQWVPGSTAYDDRLTSTTWLPYYFSKSQIIPGFEKGNFWDQCWAPEATNNIMSHIVTRKNLRVGKLKDSSGRFLYGGFADYISVDRYVYIDATAEPNHKYIGIQEYTDLRQTSMGQNVFTQFCAMKNSNGTDCAFNTKPATHVPQWQPVVAKADFNHVIGSISDPRFPSWTPGTVPAYTGGKLMPVSYQQGMAWAAGGAWNNAQVVQTVVIQYYNGSRTTSGTAGVHFRTYYAVGNQTDVLNALQAIRATFNADLTIQ